MNSAFTPTENAAQPPSAVWKQLGELLCRAGDDRGIVSKYPDTARRLSLVDALKSPDVAATAEQLKDGRPLSEKLQSLVDQASTFSKIGKCPVVGIAGLLNAGKSSLLATYLSQSGRQRVLRGVGNDQGTHRFVLWLPTLWWQQSDLLSTLIGYLSSLFGHAPEQLSSDTEVAFAQYNGQIQASYFLESTPSQPLPDGSSYTASDDSLAVPLIASDEALNELGLGLLDCPDIQTGFLSGSASTQLGTSKFEWNLLRQRQLAHIGRLCSAFIVVSKFNSLHDSGLIDILTTLREAMPGVPRILAVNKVKSRYAPEVVQEQARWLLDRFSMQDLFVAYDYRSHLASSRIPPPPKRLAISMAEPLPIFFAASGTSNNRASGSEIRYLIDLSDQLDAGTLQRESQRSLGLQLEQTVQAAFLWLGGCQSKRTELLKSAWRVIADACFEFMAERDSSGQAIGLRLQTSPAIVAQMSESLCRHAPWSMRLSLNIDRSVRSLQQAVMSSVNNLRILQTASSGIAHLVQRFRHGETGQVVTEIRLANEIERFDYQGSFARLDEKDLLAACDQAIGRFRREDSARLDTAGLDEWSQHVWKHMPWKRKLYVGAMPLAPIFAPLLAVTFIPFDGGGSTVLVFASLKELLAAAGIAALVTLPTGGNETTDIIQREAAWTQLSDLFAITCDALGILRPADNQLPQVLYDGTYRTLSPSTLPIKTPVGRTAIPSWAVVPNFETQVRGLIAALNCDHPA